MPVEPSWKKWVHRVWSLGYSRLFMVLAIVFSIVALATPMWAVTDQENPGRWDTSVYGWLGVSSDHYRQSAYDGSSYMPYSGPSFDQHVLASAVGASFTLIVVYAVLLAIVTALFSTDWAKTMPRLGLLIFTVFVVLIALAALFYPVLTVPSAAATDLGAPAMSGGFWGSTTTPDVFNWGAGLAWWLLLIAVILGAVGVALPYLQSMRGTPYPPPPQAWHPQQ
ncbi:MAG: hypothetical protein WC985_06200 [Thermoplasmata archaeon]